VPLLRYSRLLARSARPIPARLPSSGAAVAAEGDLAVAEVISVAAVAVVEVVAKAVVVVAVVN